MSQISSGPKQAVYLKDYQACSFSVQKIDLEFDINPPHAPDLVVVSAHGIYQKTDKTAQHLMLNGEWMKFLSVEMDGRELRADEFSQDDEGLKIYNVPDCFSVMVRTCFNPLENTALDGLYESGGNLTTQCEPHGFRRITYYLDRPDVLSIFTTKIIADKQKFPVLLSNGNLVEEGAAEGGRHYAIWNDPFPKPCYLFALVAGDLKFIQDEFVTMHGRKVDLRIYVRDGDQAQSYYAMDSLKKSMKWDEEVYGRDYQLDRFNIVAVSDFNMGAMENTSLNIFNTALVLAHEETATDLDFMRVEAVIAHEYFHNWTGNRVTCRDWFQLSLKEGLTVYREHEFSSDMNSRAVGRIDNVELLRTMQFPEDAGPLAHPVRPDHYIQINNFYTTTVYEKGSEVVRMQAILLGPELYRAATDLYFSRFDGHAVTCEDFIACMEEASGKDLTQFRLWYEQAGTPEVTAASHYDAAREQFSITLSQHIPDTPGQTNKLPMHIPIKFGLLSQDGREVIAPQVLELKERSETFIFDNIAARPVPSLLRDFSAPVRLTTDLSEDDLRLLMVHDTDGYNRWECAQILSLRLINRMMDALESGHTALTDRAYLDTVSTLLKSAQDQLNGRQAGGNQDLALIARMLALPHYAMIAQERSIVDPEHIYLVTRKIELDIFSHNEELLREIYQLLNRREAYHFDADSMARRALKSLVLGLLGARYDDGAAQLCADHYNQANNMTDRIAALKTLVNCEGQLREKILAEFYHSYAEYPLVVDKWFAAQAGAVRPQILDDMRVLETHAAFNIKNPNRVRSLYGTFAMRNLVMFHRADGAGYETLGRFITQLDPINPQIASRLLTSFRDWKKYSSGRQDHAARVLRDILAQKNLSPNSYEIVGKILGEIK